MDDARRSIKAFCNVIAIDMLVATCLGRIRNVYEFSECEKIYYTFVILLQLYTLLCQFYAYLVSNISY